MSNLVDEIERLEGDLQVTRLQRDARMVSEFVVDDAVKAEIERLRAALEPFAHPDLRLRLGGNSKREGDGAIVFQRNKAKLKLKHFDRAAEALSPTQEDKDV